MIVRLFAALAALSATSLAARAETPLERGAYLVKALVACGSCHTNPAPGSPELGGGTRFSELAYTAIAANLTPDPETGITQWTDADLINGLRNGKRPRGSIIGPPMPISAYRGISDDDAAAIVAYLRSVKPVVNKTARSSYRTPLPASYGPAVTSVPTVSAADPVKYGDYLVNSLAHCTDCHSRPIEGGGVDRINGLGAGGAQFRGPGGITLAPNITPSGIGHYSDAELKKVITTGERPDGTKLKPPMPVAYYANMTDKDLSAVVAYLRSMPKR